MFVFKCRQLWVALCILVSSQSSLFSQMNILSDAWGLGALHRISNDPELRARISITDKQLSETRKILSDKKLFLGVEPVFNANGSVDMVATEQRYAATGRSLLGNVLTKKQADLLRIEVVKTQIGRPSNLFSSFFLSEFGINSDEASKISTAYAEKQVKITDRMDKLLVEAIKRALPPDAQKVVWKFAGKEFSIEENGEHVDQLSEFLGITPGLQISQAPYVVIRPVKPRLSVEQRERLRVIKADVHLKMVHGKTTSDEELEQHLDAVLSKSQRFALLQSIHVELVRSDLLLVVHPNIAKHYGLSDESLIDAKAKLSESKRMIKETEIAQQIVAAKEVLNQKEIPLPVKSGIKELTAGVWAL